MKESLLAQRNRVFQSELTLRDTVLIMDFDYDQRLAAQPPQGIRSATPGLACVIGPNCPYDFRADYLTYVNLLYNYNSLATEINYRAARLGEPPVVLLEKYSPAMP